MLYSTVHGVMTVQRTKCVKTVKWWQNNPCLSLVATKAHKKERVMVTEVDLISKCCDV